MARRPSCGGSAQPAVASTQAELGVAGKDMTGAVLAVLWSSPATAVDELGPFFADDRRLTDRVAAEVVRVSLWKLGRDEVETQQGWLRADPRWVDLLLRLATAEPKTADPYDVTAQWRQAAVELLGLTGDRRATPVLLSLFGKVETQNVCDALRPLADRLLAPSLREIAAGMKKGKDRAVVEELIEALPG